MLGVASWKVRTVSFREGMSQNLEPPKNALLTLPETNSSPLKMVVSKFGNSKIPGGPYFQGRKFVSFREGIANPKHPIPPFITTPGPLCISFPCCFSCFSLFTSSSTIGVLSQTLLPRNVSARPRRYSAAEAPTFWKEWEKMGGSTVRHNNWVSIYYITTYTVVGYYWLQYKPLVGYQCWVYVYKYMLRVYIYIYMYMYICWVYNIYMILHVYVGYIIHNYLIWEPNTASVHALGSVCPTLTGEYMTGWKINHASFPEGLFTLPETNIFALKNGGFQ